jgi:hypothetical protein
LVRFDSPQLTLLTAVYAGRHLPGACSRSLLLHRPSSPAHGAGAAGPGLLALLAVACAGVRRRPRARATTTAAAAPAARPGRTTLLRQARASNTMPPTTPSAATAAAAAAHFILPSLLLQISVVATDVSASSRGVVLDTLPTLQWPVPREWLNVKTGCSSAVGASATAAVGAVGDGTADDTAAIQACFDMVSNESQHLSVYIPAGTYKVTSECERQHYVTPATMLVPR